MSTSYYIVLYLKVHDMLYTICIETLKLDKIFQVGSMWTTWSLYGVHMDNMNST